MELVDQTERLTVSAMLGYPTTSYAFLGLRCLVCKIKKKPSTPSTTSFSNNDIYKLTSQIYSNQQALLQTQSSGKQLVSNPKIRALINSAISMLQQGADEQQAGLTAFVQNANQPGSAAYQFRSDLKTMIGDMMATSSEVLSYANNAGPSLQLQNSGARSLTDQMPPALLFPLYEAMSKIGVIDEYGSINSNVTQYFEQAPSTLETLRSIENPTSTVSSATAAFTATATATTSTGSTNSLGRVCTSVLSQQTLAKHARDFLKGAGVFSR